MEEFNWKKELKRMLSELADGLYSMLCICLVAMTALHYQDDVQSKAINTIINSKDWSVILIFLVGLIALGFGLRTVITGLFLLIKFIFRLFKK